LPLAIGIAVSMIPAGFYQATREVAAGARPTGISTQLGVVPSGGLFAVLVAAGIITRKKRDAHARWLLLATLKLAFKLPTLPSWPYGSSHAQRARGS
jgi:hypothetical protein